MKWNCELEDRNTFKYAFITDFKRKSMLERTDIEILLIED